MDPLILTARYDPETQGWLQEQRDRFFPADRNIVPAHLTLFHKLPGEELRAVEEAVEDAADTLPVPARIADVRFFGRGGAFVVRSEGLERVRADLAKQFGAWLGAQDRQGFRAHVTYQNKVTKAAAQRGYETVLREFAPFDATVTGLDLWWYRGGPWEAAHRTG